MSQFVNDNDDGKVDVESPVICEDITPIKQPEKEESTYKKVCPVEGNPLFRLPATIEVW